MTATLHGIKEVPMSKRDRQGARTVADLERRGIKRAMRAASNSLNVAKKAETEVYGKVGKKDYDAVVEMLNASNAIVRLLAGRLIIESDNFTLDQNGSVVAKDITLQNGAETDDYSVKIADGVVKINSPLSIIGEGAYQVIDLLHFNIYGFGMHKLRLIIEIVEGAPNLETGETPELECVFVGFDIKPVE